MKLIGYAFETGRIDFARDDNPWAFEMIDSGMKTSQKDRIVLDPLQAPIELLSAEVNENEPEWMKDTEQLLQSANRIILQYREPGFLRFRKATHDAKNDRQFVTIGNQDEATLYAEENWANIRYFFATRRNIVNFDVSALITHKSGQGAQEQGVKRIEFQTRMDVFEGSARMTFDSSGSKASTDIIEWRGTVAEGETGRYAPDNSFIELMFTQVNRPFTFLHEDRKEFANHSFTFSGEKMDGLLSRVIKNRMKEAAEISQD